MVRRNFAWSILFTAFLCSSSSLLFAKPVSVEQARKVADTFLKAHHIRQARTPKTLSKTTQKAPQERFKPACVKNIRGEDGKILAYVAELKPEGYIITAADSNIRPILGYSFKGQFPFEDSEQNALLHLVQWDVEARLKVLRSSSPKARSVVQTNSERWHKYLAADERLVQTLSSVTQWPYPYWCPACTHRQSNPGPCEQCGTPVWEEPGWITAHWYQTDPYNRFCPRDPLYPLDPGQRCRVGCTAIAAGQIINHWKYPGSVRFSSAPWWQDGDAYESWYWDESMQEYAHIVIDADHNDLDFPSFEELNTELGSIDYAGDINEIAYLCFAVGIKHGMRYSQADSACALNPSAYLYGFNYGSAIGGSWPWGLWPSYESKVIENIKKGWPVQIGIQKSGNAVGHSVIVDGYRTSGDTHFHINYCAGGMNDWWYNPPDITENWDVVTQIVYDICPYQGWNQWGADAKNSFGTLYTYPANEPNLKWEVPVDPNLFRYKFDYMVVGTGNKMYASLSPCDMGQGYCPYICVINPYGYIEKTIPVTDSEYDIDYLAQNNRGEVFFGTSEFADRTSIYRIDPKTEAVTRIFDHTSPDGGHFDQPIKTDQDNYLYFVVTPKLAANSTKFYSINRSGSVFLAHTFPPEMKFYTSVAAIDEARNHVYLNYYNESESKSYLVCFNRSLGLVSWTHAFPGTHTSSEMAGAPAVGEDGTIYIGCFTTLYALSPDNGNEIWSKDFYPAYANRTPAIGRDGTLYVNYGKMIDSIWHPGFIRALDPANGNIKWEREVSPPLETYDNMGEMYAAGNGMVGFTYSRSGVAHIGGLVDHGDSGEILWDIEYGGKMIFGPGQTIYVVSSICDASSIYALSVGERGDPDGLGMGYADNRPPAMPSNPTPGNRSEKLDSAVTLSWDCSDPDGHALKYSIFVGESGYDMVPVAIDVNDSSYVLEGLKPNTGYAWKIIATDGQAVSEGPTWVFATKPPNPDLNGDRIVNFLDFTVLACYWDCMCPETCWCAGADIDWSGEVDFVDLGYIASGWLEDMTSPFQASYPSPPDGATGVDVNADLSWSPGSLANSHDVYFGTGFCGVNYASPWSPEYKGNQFDCIYDPDVLDSNSIYYWRIDEVGDTETWKGNVWSFTTGP